MNIKSLKIALCMGLLYSSAHAMQQGQNAQAIVRQLCRSINSLDANLRNQHFETEANIINAQDMLQRLQNQLRPELARRQQAAECHTVSPVINALFEQLGAKFEELRATLGMIQHYNAAIDGDGNEPLATFNQLKLDAKIALGRFFRIINQQPFRRDPQTPTFEQCLQATSLAKKWELACIAHSCYQRWIAQAQPVAPAQAAPAPGNVPQMRGQEQIVAWRNFLTDLYMQWLIKLDNIRLLVNNLADYLTPDAVNAADQSLLHQGQNAIHALSTQGIPQMQARVVGDLRRIATIGRQIQGSLQQTDGLLNQITQQAQRVGDAINHVEGVLTDDTIELAAGVPRYIRTPYRAVGADIVGGITRGIRSMDPRAMPGADIVGGITRGILSINPFAMPAIDDAQSAQPQVQQQADQEQPLDENRLRTTLQGVRTSLHGISQLMRTLNIAQLAQQPIAAANQLLTDDLINAPEQLQRQIPTYLGAGHLNLAERLNQLNTVLHRYTREERLGDLQFRAWLEAMARTGSEEINRAQAESAGNVTRP